MNCENWPALFVFFIQSSIWVSLLLGVKTWAANALYCPYPYVKSHYLRSVFHLKKYCVALCLILLCITAAVAQTMPPDGKYRSVYPSGKTDETGRYLNGVKTGMWYKYTEKGTMLLKQKWNNGSLRWQVEYVNGRRARITDSKGNTKILPACGCS